MRAQCAPSNPRPSPRPPRPHLSSWSDGRTIRHRSTETSLTVQPPRQLDTSTATPIDCPVSISTGQAGQRGHHQHQHSTPPPPSSSGRAAFPHNNSTTTAQQLRMWVELAGVEYTHNNSRNIFRISPSPNPSTPVDDANHFSVSTYDRVRTYGHPNTMVIYRHAGDSRQDRRGGGALPAALW